MESFATHGETEAVMKLRQTFTCPLELTHDMIKGKWKPIILWRLRLGKTTLAQLERDIDGITQKMLLEHLKELTAFGFVDKKVSGGYPLKTVYFLTKPQGEQVLEALTILQKIGISYMKEHGMEELLQKRGLL